MEDAAWTSLVASVRADHGALRDAVERHALDSERAFGESVGAIAHLAYHLGAVRQKLAALRS